MNNKSTPIVSIIIPVYNGANYLRESIDSALAQTYGHVEIIVVNDGSNDDGLTDQIILSYGDRIRYFKKENGGVASALNLGIREMRGEYFSWLSHDDLYLPEKVERQVLALLAHGGKAIATCQVRTITASGEKIKEVLPADRLISCPRWFLALDVDSGLDGCSLLIPQNAFETYGLFNEQLRATQDYDMWYRILADHDVVLLKQTLVLSRKHDKQVGVLRAEMCNKEGDEIHARFIDDLDASGLAKYIGGDMLYLHRLHMTYFESGYWKTTATLLRVTAMAFPKKDIAPIFEKMIHAVLGEIVYGDDQRVADVLIDWIDHSKLKDSKKRILLYSYPGIIGGIQRVLETLLPCLAKHYSLVLTTPTENEKDKGISLPDDVLKIMFKECPEKNLGQRLATLALILDADLFIGIPNVLEEVIDSYEPIRQAGVRCIAWDHSSFFVPYQYTWLHAVALKRLAVYRVLDAVVWPTRFNAEAYGMLADNAVSIPNPAPFPPQQNLVEKKGKIILCVGRMDDALKRMDRALLVFYKVLQMHPDARLWVVGPYRGDMLIADGSGRTVDMLIKDLGFPPESISFFGSQRDVEKYYKKAALNILPSETEGFGMTIIEAAAFGVPTVAFDIAGIGEIIVDGDNGFLVTKDDIGAMAERVSRLLADESLRALMGEKARSSLTIFLAETVSRRWAELIDAVLEGRVRESSLLSSRDRLSWLLRERERMGTEIVRCYDQIVHSLMRELTLKRTRRTIKQKIKDIIHRWLDRLL